MKKILLSFFVLSILLPIVAFAFFDTSLKYGSRGDAVIELQDFLQDQGVYLGKSDGRFGLGTRKAVIAFQLANGLKGDGYFGLGSRTKANSILTTTLQPSIEAEQTETGTTINISMVAGCTLTSTYSSTTGKPCSSTIQPTTPNLPAGCTSTFGFSVTTGQTCNGIASTVQQLKQTVQQQAQTIQQIQQNTQQIAQNTTPASVVVPVVDTTPKEVTQAQLPSSLSVTPLSNEIDLYSAGSQKNDIITVTFNGNTVTKTVDTIGVGFTFKNLSPETLYPFTYKIQRGYDYILGSLTAKTDLGFKCDRDSSSSCTNFFTKPIEITKIKSNIMIPLDISGNNFASSVSCSLSWNESTLSQTLQNFIDPQNPNHLFSSFIPIEFSTSIIIQSNESVAFTSNCQPVSHSYYSANFARLEYEWHLVD